MKKILYLFFLISPCLISSQELKNISGIVTSNNIPKRGITVSIEGTTKSTLTDVNGFYKIDAQKGQTITFDYYRFEKTSILIEDVTKVLNLKMFDKSDFFEPEKSKQQRFKNETIGLNYIDFVGFTIDPKTLNKNTSSITKAILEKTNIFISRKNELNEDILYLKGRELNGPVFWKIDNVALDIPYPMNFSDIESISILNNQNIGNCIIFIKTKKKSSKKIDIQLDNYLFNNNDYYSSDAVKYKKIKAIIPLYLKKYEAISNFKNAVAKYNETYLLDKNENNYHINLYNYFRKNYRKKDILLKILSDYENISKDNPEDLKVIAYKYQELKKDMKAIEIYKKILVKRPNYIQSYRDLANAFLTIKDYKSAWRTYNFYFRRKFKFDKNDISSIIYSEMVATYHLDEESKNFMNIIRLTDIQKNRNKDLRLVFEWNTTEAEFEIEFVNPSLLSYKIENSLIHNDALILDQKKKGYTSKEIFIDKIHTGNWLVNFTYFGNKTNISTTLKVTRYYNWGRKNQKSKVFTFDFTEPNIKTQLLKLIR